MPYSAEHKQKTRAHIVETARKLFNQKGFERVSIDVIMKEAGLTRGGFYNHFPSKAALYAEAVDSFLMGRGAQWREEAGVHSAACTSEAARNMVISYLSDEHLGDIEGQCPMIALPSDIARASPEIRAAYQRLLTAMTGLFEAAMDKKESRQQALSMSALLIGGMVIARALPENAMAREVRQAAMDRAMALID